MRPRELLARFEIPPEIFICVISGYKQRRRPRYWNDFGALMGSKLAKNKAPASVLQPATDSAASCSSCCARIYRARTHTRTSGCGISNNLERHYPGIFHALVLVRKFYMDVSRRFADVFKNIPGIPREQTRHVERISTTIRATGRARTERQV